MTYPYGTPVTFITRTFAGVDADGNDVLADGASYSTVAAFAPAGAPELVQGQDQVTDQPQLYLQDIVDATAYDVVVVDGIRYNIDASPDLYTNPSMGFRGLVVKLLSVSG